MSSRGLAACALPGVSLAASFFTYAPHERLFQARFAILRAQVAGRAVPMHSALLQYRNRGAQLLHVGEYVGGEEKRAPLAREPAQHGFHRDAGRRVKAAHGLVEHVEIAREEKRRSEPELLRHALRQAAHRALEHGGFELELGEQCLRAPGVVAPAEAARQELDELAAAQVVRGHETLRDVGEAPA